MPTDVNGLLIYDGGCGFCAASADWIAAKWKNPGAEAVPSQQLGDVGLERLGLTARDVGRAAWWVEDGRKAAGHLAVARALAAAEGGWGLVGRVMLIPPFRWFAAIGYVIVTHFRHRLPGRRAACEVKVGHTPTEPDALTHVPRVTSLAAGEALRPSGASGSPSANWI